MTVAGACDMVGTEPWPIGAQLQPTTIHDAWRSTRDVLAAAAFFCWRGGLLCQVDIACLLLRHSTRQQPVLHICCKCYESVCDVDVRAGGCLEEFHAELA